MAGMIAQTRDASLRTKVAVITGASSGIGRATAHAFAEAGSGVVLAARRSRALAEVQRECEELGADALAHPTDVTDEEQVRALGRATLERFGRFDVWVNNAGVSLFGRLEETPMSDFERVIRTNLLGYAYGAQVAIRHFRERGRGVLINVSSAVGYKAQPYTSAYAASKFAVRGFSESLRMELLDADEIHVCTSLPGSIDTPLFQHAANHTGRAVKPLEPVYPPELVAVDILRLARRPRRELVTGAAAHPLPLLDSVAPGLGERVMARVVQRDHFQHRASPPASGNLFDPNGNHGGRVSGGWSHLRRGRSKRLTPWLLAATGLAAAAAVPLLRR